MEITRGMILNLALEDFHVRTQWLYVWTRIAKEELDTRATPWRPVHAMLFSAYKEARSRRELLAAWAPKIMGNEIPEPELEAKKMLRAIEAQWLKPREPQDDEETKTETGEP